MSDKKKRDRPGQPPKYECPKEFQAKIDEYFAKVRDKDGNWLKPPTGSGLALHLGFADRKSLYHYRDRDEFYMSVKQAMTMIESYHEEKIGYGKSAIGNIFALKNFGWTDRQEITNKGNVGIVWNEERTYKKDDEADDKAE
jgi:hypothetical protein